ncbi:MAG: Ig-like domain-containing protein [Acidobacteriota bacterium]
MIRSVCAAAVLVACLVTPALADRPRTLIIPRPRVPSQEAVTSNVIFLDRCASGCTLHLGGDNSTTDSSSIVKGTSTLSAFNCGDAVWQQVKSCVAEVFAPYNVVITDVDPGTASHLEIKIAGNPCDVLPSGYCNSVGGVAPATCGSYQQNALVFDFANVWNCSVDEICATAAQEIAHTWSLDHVTDKTDPMTYFAYNGVRFYHDSVKCGSDCTSSSGALCKVGDTGCTGPEGQACNSNQEHTCRCNPGTTVQNDNQFITNLFGAGTPMPPTVTITKPANGASVSPGFPVDTTIASPYGVMMAELRIDGTLVSTVNTMPYVFNAPQDLAAGTHTVEVTGYDILNTPGKATATVLIGMPCSKPADCPVNTDTCIGGRCVPGPGVQGGLGSKCTDGAQCADGLCASDGTNMYCTEPCMTGQCPSGFGCLATGATGSNASVCWPGYDDGSGGGCSTDGGAPVTLGLLALGLLVSRRRRA